MAVHTLVTNVINTKCGTVADVCNDDSEHDVFWSDPIENED
jgi:hypothetical protein